MFKYEDNHFTAIRKIPQWIQVVLVAIYIMVLAYMLEPASTAEEQTYIHHIVEGGETLWSIAQQYRSDADPRKIVYQIHEINKVTPIIQAGQVLLIPMQ
ncbi:MAG: Cell division suppressor protein YneA [candidate division WS2 bacterium]|nr:Cell division suppressor protein YneA [Candidatus Psychracetigena formicireducens]